MLAACFTTMFPTVFECFRATFGVWRILVWQRSIDQEEEVAESLQGALASLEQATELGDRLVGSQHGHPLASAHGRPGKASAHTGITPRIGAAAASPAGAQTSGVDEAAGEAMLRLAKLCEVLSTGDAELGAGAGGGGRGPEELAALAVREYLRAMAIG